MSNDIEIGKPVPTDGFRSRKFIVTAVLSITVEAIASISLFVNKMDADQWIGFNQWLCPLMLAIFCGSTVWEKFVYKKGD